MRRVERVSMNAFSAIPSRRRFILGILPIGSLFCLGSRNLLALDPLGRPHKNAQEQDVISSTHKFQADSQMTFEDVFRFTFQNYYIPNFPGSRCGRHRLCCRVPSRFCHGQRLQPDDKARPSHNTHGGARLL